MNNMRKLMEMVEAGELGSVPTSNNDVEINGQGIILYEDQVAIYDEAGEYQIFLPIETWNAFKEAGNTTSESITEEVWDKKDVSKLKKSFTKEEEELFPITPITSPDGDTFKFNAIRYNIVPNDLMVKLWEPNSDVYDSFDIHYATLKRIVDAIERKL